MPRQLSVVRRFGNRLKTVWNSNLSGVASQPTQPPVPSEASRDPIHLGWLWAAWAGEQKLSDNLQKYILHILGANRHLLLQAKHYYSQAIKLAPSNMRALYGLLLTTRWSVFLALGWIGWGGSTNSPPPRYRIKFDDLSKTFSTSQLAASPRCPATRRKEFVAVR